MRGLSKNMTKLWLVSVTGYTDELDGDGNYTGQVIPVRSTPVIKYISLYPNTGSVIHRQFGIDGSYDMVAVSNTVELNETDLLFLTEPTGDYDVTYDYIIDKKMVSLNVFAYGLQKRV